ncbi:MAG: leucine-rich repeat domain-containing protein [Candidatus Kariarchaeaceae archaeon]|jgi:hypothetical protein
MSQSKKFGMPRQIDRNHQIVLDLSSSTVKVQFPKGHTPSEYQRWVFLFIDTIKALGYEETDTDVSSPREFMTKQYDIKPLLSIINYDTDKTTKPKKMVLRIHRKHLKTKYNIEYADALTLINVPIDTLWFLNAIFTTWNQNRIHNWPKVELKVVLLQYQWTHPSIKRMVNEIHANVMGPIEAKTLSEKVLTHSVRTSIYTKAQLQKMFGADPSSKKKTQITTAGYPGGYIFYRIVGTQLAALLADETFELSPKILSNDYKIADPSNLIHPLSDLGFLEKFGAMIAQSFKEEMVKWINLYQQLTAVTPIDSSLIKEWKELLSQEIIFVPTMPPSTYNFLVKERKRRTQPLLQDPPIAESISDWTTLQYLLGNLIHSISLESVVKRLHTDLVDEEGKTVNVDINDLKLDLDSLRIRSLDLSNLNLKTIPKLITTLPELRSLDMSNNPGLIIGSQLEEMRELTILELRSCGINTLELPYLPHLELLDLRSNRLTRVPELDQMPNLKALYLQDNPLKPDISINHEQLEELVLSFKLKETAYEGCPSIKSVRVE